ncbi:hypothetical protein MES5069_130070 [Mesorhizobium escarrei]|uniref:Uncharacterized protein n=1 Tax=Mesorhizobium escarrei TaxID=666018 RepID=A0ABM9DHR5_9HYPH|nr:hypothetical protein MES5069_130070 [Mesorhizobium escarrei]
MKCSEKGRIWRLSARGPKPILPCIRHAGTRLPRRPVTPPRSGPSARLATVPRICWKRSQRRLPRPSPVWRASSMPCCARARPGRNVPTSPGRKSARHSAIWCASPSRCRNSSFTASRVPSSARGGLAAVSASDRRRRRRDMKFRPTKLPASAENPLTSSQASACRHPSTGTESAAPDVLAASHHPAASDPDLLDAFNRDASLQKWTVPEAAEAANALWGKTAATAIAWCAFSAYCDGRTQEYRFWFRVFAYLQAGSPDSEAGAASGKARPGSSR